MQYNNPFPLDCELKQNGNLHFKEGIPLFNENPYTTAFYSTSLLGFC